MWTTFNTLLDDRMTTRDKLFVNFMIMNVLCLLNEPNNRQPDDCVKSYLDALVNAKQLGVCDMVLVENDRLMIINFSIEVKYCWMQMVFIKKDYDIDTITLNNIKF